MKKLVLPLLTLIIGFIIGYYYSNSRSGSTGTTAGGPYTSQNSISYDEAKMLVDTFNIYGMQDANHIPGGKGPKTRSAFLPIKMLDSLCAALDAEQKKDGVDGLRIYFARYPKYHLDGKTQYEMAYHNTIVMVSTKGVKILPRGAKDSLYIHRDFFGSSNKGGVMHLFALDPQNRMELCPDSCDGDDLICPDPSNPDCGN